MDKKLTNYEKALLRIELMKLKQYEIDIGNCNAKYLEKRAMEKEIEETTKYIKKTLEEK